VTHHWVDGRWCTTETPIARWRCCCGSMSASEVPMPRESHRGLSVNTRHQPTGRSCKTLLRYCAAPQQLCETTLAGSKTVVSISRNPTAPVAVHHLHGMCSGCGVACVTAWRPHHSSSPRPFPSPPDSLTTRRRSLFLIRP